MLKTSELLRSCKSVRSFDVLDFKEGKDFYYLRVEAILRDETTLHIREYVSISERMYSYHWQDTHRKTICRWDNAPHHKGLTTFPHHKHTQQGIEACFKNTLEDVLAEIDTFKKAK